MKERLALLLQSGVISQNAYTGTNNAVQLIAQHLNIDASNEQFQMAMTHLARAVDRIYIDEPIADGLDPDILNEIYADDAFQQISTLHQAILDIYKISDVPETENSFLISNLFSLFYACQPKEDIC